MDKMIFTAVVAILLVFNTFHVQAEDKSPHYGVHLLTGTCACFAPFLCAITAAAITAAGSVVTTLKINPNAYNGAAAPDLVVLPSVSAFLGYLAGYWFVYKTPQWTDTYILKKAEERTTEQNMITFLNRAFIWYPIGILTGEFFSNQCNPTVATSDIKSEEAGVVDTKK